MTSNRDNAARCGCGGNSRFTSENISFRLHRNQLDLLREEAAEKQISLNALVSQIVDSYVNYASNAPKAGMMPVHKLSQVLLLEGYSEDQIKEIAERLMKSIRIETPLLIRGRYDFETVVSNYSYWLKATGFQYRHSKDAQTNTHTHTFIVEHDMGRKFSLFASECSKVYFEPVVIKEVKCAVTENSIMIVVEGKAE